ALRGEAHRGAQSLPAVRRQTGHPVLRGGRLRGAALQGPALSDGDLDRGRAGGPAPAHHPRRAERPRRGGDRPDRYESLDGSPSRKGRALARQARARDQRRHPLARAAEQRNPGSDAGVRLTPARALISDRRAVVGRAAYRFELDDSYALARSSRRVGASSGAARLPPIAHGVGWRSVTPANLNVLMSRPCHLTLALG